MFGSTKKSRMTRHWLSNSCLLVATLLWALRAIEGLDCQTDGEVRLRGGTGANPLEGRLEVCLYSSVDRKLVWGAVCNQMWGRAEAEVVCRQLGVAQENFTQIVPSVFFDTGGTLPFHWSETDCTGEETHLVNCSRTSQRTCHSSEKIGLICNVSVPECEDESVRIVDASGSNATEGRVEFCLKGRWGSVCQSSWDNNDAKVVCRQLGILPNEPKIIESSETPRAAMTVPIGLDSVSCTGTEERLGDCPRAAHVEGCYHVNDVGVNCTYTIECPMEGEVRLVGGSGPMEGRVEYCRDNLWIPVCTSNWDHKDAQVVCRQLGFVGIAISELREFGTNPDHRNRDELEPRGCTGNETRLSDCPIQGHCTSGPAAGVQCYNESNCEPSLGVRLRGGVFSDQMGTVELCYGDWGFVCDDQWDDNDAQVVCRQLGFTGGVAINESPFGTEPGRFLLDNLACTGNEASIAECSHPGLGSHNCHSRMEDQAAVICGTTRDAPLPRCIGEQLSRNVTTANTSIPIGNFGICEQFIGQSSICGAVYSETPSHVYHTFDLNQNALLHKLDQILMVLDDDLECTMMIKSVVCHYFLPPCGEGGVVYLPRGVCSEECSHVQDQCRMEWNQTNAVVGVALERSIDCEATQSYLSPLPVCCTDAGIDTNSENLTVTVETPASTPPTGAPTVVVAAIVTSLLALLLIIVVTTGFVIGCVISARKRKVSLRMLQMSMLSSASTRSSYQRNSNFFMGSDDPKAMLRNGSVSKGPMAVPNPYSNKQELDFDSPTSETGIMNRISSSIIRELSSTLLIPYSRLKLLDCVGHGEFGVVYKAHYTEPDWEMGYKTSIVAVKTLKGMYDQDQVDKIMEESIKMKNFDHPHVLTLLGVCLDAGSAPYVVMPYMANGSLLHYLKKERRNLVLPVGTDEDVRCEVCKRLVVICMQISSGMEYLAHERFVHRDLAARNCMIDIHFVIKIADFGLSEDMYAKNYYRQSEKDKSTKLPVKWMAPESLTDGIFSEKSDVWSFGVTCWEVFSGGKTPYPGVDPMTLSKMLEEGKRLSKPLNSACPEEMYRVMKQCWARTPDQRPTFTDLMETISEYAEKIAGYLDFNSYNPFAATYEEIKPLDSNSIVSSAEQVFQHMKNKAAHHKFMPHNLPTNSSQPLFRQKGSLTPNPSPRHTPLPSPKRRLSVPVIITPRIQITVTDETPV